MTVLFADAVEFQGIHFSLL